MIRELRSAMVVFLLLTVVTGVVYPALVTLVARWPSPSRRPAASSRVDGKLVGSRLIGQPFSSPRYFWGRPSATGPDAEQRRRVVRLEPGSAEPGAADGRRGAASRRCAPPIRATRGPCRSTS